MARYTGPKTKISRIFGEPILGNGKWLNKNSNPPGQHGAARKRKSLGEYALQLREKQKAKRIYGVLEAQFANYFEKADRIPGVTGENLLRLLEMRLDNVVYRLGYGRSRTEARQVVRHNHILVNGKKVNIPSYQVKIGDVIEIKEKSKGLQRFKDITDTTASRIIPEWLEADIDNLKGKVVALPERDQIDIDIQETLIVELYSK